MSLLPLLAIFLPAVAAVGGRGEECICTYLFSLIPHYFQIIPNSHGRCPEDAVQPRPRID